MAQWSPGLGLIGAQWYSVCIQCEFGNDDKNTEITGEPETINTIQKKRAASL